MRTTTSKPAARKPRKDLAGIIREKQGVDAARSERTNRRAHEAADRLMREMDEFLRNSPRKPD